MIELKLLHSTPERVIERGLEQTLARIERGYGLGRGRTDLLVIWPWPGGLRIEERAGRRVVV